MRRRGDTAWNEDDYNLACETSNRLKVAGGFIPGGEMVYDETVGAWVQQ
jgi:hypothetical protein